MYCQLLQDSTLLSLGCETTFWQLAGEPAFRNIGLLAVAVIGIGFAIYRSIKLHQQTKTAIRQAEISEAGLDLDRFHSAAKMLSSDNASTRLAGVLLLKWLAKINNKEHTRRVFLLLTSFLENYPPQLLKHFDHEAEGKTFPKFAADFHAALLSIIVLKGDNPTLRIVLLDLVFYNITFESKDISEANLSGSEFYDCNFQNTDFTETYLYATKFINCKNLTYAQLSQSKYVDPEFLAKLKAEEDKAATKTAKSTEENTPT